MAPAEGAEANGEVPKEEDGEQGPVVPTHEPFSFGIFAHIGAKQGMNGLRHNDHMRYRHYCTRRLRTLYTKLNLKHGTRNKYKQVIMPADFQDKRYLEVPLMMAERAWAFAIQVKSDNASAATFKKAHQKYAGHRMKRAKEYSVQLDEMCKVHGDTRTQLEAEAYQSFMLGSYELEREKWEQALELLQKCKKSLEHLALASSAETQEAFKNKLQDLAPLIREARYNMGMMFQEDEDEGHTFKTKKVAASKDLSEFTYRGHGLAIPSATLKSKLVQCVTMFNGIKADGEEESTDVIDSYGAVSVEFRDTMKDIHHDMIAAGTEGQSDEWRMLEAFARELSICVTAERDLKLLRNHFVKFDSLGAVTLATNDGRKNSRPDEGMRFCELLKDSIEGLKELPDTTDVVKTVLSAYVQIVMNCRCFLLAMCHLAMSKPLEAAALLDMLHERLDDVVLNEGLHDPLSRLHGMFRMLHESLPSRVSRWRCRVLAQLCDEDMKKKAKKTEVPTTPAADKGQGEKKSSDKGLEELAATIGFPPKFEELPCKPLLFDLAYRNIEEPNFDGSKRKKAAASAPAAQQSSSQKAAAQGGGDQKGLLKSVASGVGSRIGSLFGGRK